MIVKNNKIIIENALQKQDLDYMQSIYGGYDMPWEYNDGVAAPEDNDFQFVVPVWGTMKMNDMAFNATVGILNILEPEFLLKIKANLRTKTETILEAGMHRDTKVPGSLTAIFYLNTCDGYTKFEDGDKIDSVENTLIIFPGRLKHAGTNCTNTNRRLVANVNYIPNPNNHLWKMLMTPADDEYQKFWSSK